MILNMTWSDPDPRGIGKLPCTECKIKDSPVFGDDSLHYLQGTICKQGFPIKAYNTITT